MEKEARKGERERVVQKRGEMCMRGRGRYRRDRGKKV